MVYAETEGNIITILRQKQEIFKQMQSEMNEAMAEHGLFRDDKRLKLSIPDNKIAKGDNWTMILGDCVTETAKLPTNSIDFGIHSPPFANLYIYSDSEADMGNSADDDEFFTHYEFLIKELLRTTKPGRLCAIHCKDLPSYMNRDGAAGLVDFPGRIIQAFEKSRLDGDTDTRWQYHSRITIWKDPVIEMQRTKNHGLLHKNFTSTADAVRQGMPDYMIVFRKWPIDGGEPVKQHRVPGDYIGTEPPTVHGKMTENDRRLYSIHVWQRYASPVWFDIDQTNVLNYQMSKDGKDEKHICPLQLDVIARCVDLWTNKGETVFSPFAGIGSEGYESVKLGRKFIGVELKESYWRHAQRYLADAERIASTPDLFAWADAQKEKQAV
jgi:DNA modification methylase